MSVRKYLLMVKLTKCRFKTTKLLRIRRTFKREAGVNWSFLARLMSGVKIETDKRELLKIQVISSRIDLEDKLQMNIRLAPSTSFGYDLSKSTLDSPDPGLIHQNRREIEMTNSQKISYVQDVRYTGFAGAITGYVNGENGGSTPRQRRIMPSC